MPHQTGSDNLDFLDGYLFRTMVQILNSEGADPAGFYNYYKARVEQVGTALSPYDRMLVDYVDAKFDRPSRRIVHGGTGLGTLPCALAFSGYTVAGVEQDAGRLRTAGRIRAALAEAWPAMTERYELIEGEFPTVLAGTPWMAPETVLIFTNCVATWPDGLSDRIIGFASGCGDVILDTRLFGQSRDTPEERQTLIDQFEAQGLVALPIAGSPSGAFYYHLQPRQAVP